MKENRRRVIRISKEMLEMVLTGCKYGYTSTLPEDLEVIGVLPGDRPDMFRVVVQAESFDPIPGDPLPEINPTFTRLDYNDQIKEYIDTELDKAEKHAAKDTGAKKGS